MPDAPSETELLLAFLRERHALCPRCSYDLCNLTEPVCPECNQRLHLQVGVKALPLAWLLVTLAPGFASGIFAGMMAVLSVIFWSAPPFELIAVGCLGVLSGTAALTLSVNSRTFRRLPNSSQMAIAGIVWALHVALFAVLVATA